MLFMISAAQIRDAYEIAMGFALVGVLLLVGKLELQVGSECLFLIGIGCHYFIIPTAAETSTI